MSIKTGRETYWNLPEYQKQKLVEYEKMILENEKKGFVIIIRHYIHLKNLPVFRYGLREWIRQDAKANITEANITSFGRNYFALF